MTATTLDPPAKRTLVRSLHSAGVPYSTIAARTALTPADVERICTGRQRATDPRNGLNDEKLRAKTIARRRRVKVMADLGVTNAEICRVVGIDPAKLAEDLAILATGVLWSEAAHRRSGFEDPGSNCTVEAGDSNGLSESDLIH